MTAWHVHRAHCAPCIVHVRCLHNGKLAFPRLRWVASLGAGFAPLASHDDFGRLAVPLAGVSSIKLLSGSSVLPFVLAALADGIQNGCTTIMVIDW